MRNKNNLSKEDIFNFYNYVCAYEENIKADYGRFHFDDPNFTTFCKQNNINPKKKLKNPSNNFWFKSFPKRGINDMAHHLLRHIRNAFAHGLITKKKDTFYFKDFSTSEKQTQTMGGQMRCDLFWSFLEELIKTKK